MVILALGLSFFALCVGVTIRLWRLWRYPRPDPAAEEAAARARRVEMLNDTDLSRKAALLREFNTAALVTGKEAVARLFAERKAESGRPLSAEVFFW
jgi:hypothetical protein